MPSRARLLALLLAAAPTAPMALGAQGNLSNQGLGFPPGELSAAALGTAGAAGEIDPASPLNPSSISRWLGATSVHASYAPEFRRVRIAGDEGRSTVSRFPSFGAVIGVSGRANVGLSASTLLDRSFATRFSGSQVIGADTIDATESLRAEGAINDVRLAGAYQLGQRLHVGLGLHVITGQNRYTFARTFPDTSAFGSITQTDRLDFTGQAVSLGAEWQPIKSWVLSGSARFGGTLRAKSVEDSVRAEGRVPDRAGASLSYTGFSGSTLVARADWTEWSALEGIVVSGTRARDAWDFGAGAEVQGPRFANRIINLRAGVRQRGLPFTALGENVDESSVAGGLSFPLAGNRATFDASASRASRTGGSVKETGWTFGFGLTVRP